MAWIRETRIRIFMQMELGNCRNELVWLKRCHNYASDNYPEKEYPLRSLPIPPDSIENLQRRLGKAMKGILPPTLKMILKTHYPLPARKAPVYLQQHEISLCSQEEQLETSLEVQPGDMMGKHRDGEHNPLERPQVSEKEENVVADGISHAGQGNCFVFQTEVGVDLETSQVAARHFLKLAMFRQQQGTVLFGRLPCSSRLRKELENNSSTATLRSPGCDRPATARDDVDRAKQAV